MQVNPLPYTPKPLPYAGMLHFGTATGFLSLNRWDGYAPDPGLPMLLEPSALAQHMIILGATGVGKTVLIKQLIQDYLHWGKGGLLIMDGKGALAAEFKHLKNYVYLDPRECVISLFEGLDPQGVTRALAEINMRADAKDPIWQNLTNALVAASAEILWYLVKYEEARQTPDEDRVWRWSFYDLDRVAVMIQSETDSDKKDTAAYMGVLKAGYPQEMQSLLGGAIAFVEHEIPAMAESVRGSVLGNYKSWTAPVLSHPNVLRWARADRSDKDPEACLKGGVVGINLGEVMFGRAGVIASSFLKNRIYTKGKLRADHKDWEVALPGSTPCWIVQDEYPAIATEAEVTVALQGRSLGLWLCVLAQNVEAIYATNTNANSINAFLGNLLNRITMQTTPQSAKWLQEVVGPVWIPGWVRNTQGINYIDSASNALGSVLYDTSHPDRPFFQSLLRRGFGSFHKIHFPKTGRQVVTSDDHAERSTRHNVVVGGQWQEEPLISLADFIGKTQKITKGGKGLTPEGGVAFVQVMRAGAIRRDFVQLLPPGPIAEDLLDPTVTAEERMKHELEMQQIREQVAAFNAQEAEDKANAEAEADAEVTA